MQLVETLIRFRSKSGKPMRRSSRLTFFIFSVCWLCGHLAEAQCSGQIMEPGFAFLTSSRGCAPFTVRIETLYLSSTPGTQYFVDWGDGTAEEVYIQTNATGVEIQHTYPNSPVDCGYDITIDAANGCNPRGSVVPVTTQVIVWTNDVVSIDPGTFRVCQGYAASVQFTDNSDWNCYPRATRENNEPRWIQWIYGTGTAANRIPGIQVDGNTPGAYPYLDPDPGRNPVYPVLSPGETSLPINIPVTTPADIGREFEVTLKNWNQCNPYDNVVTDGNAFNPVGGDLVNGDNAPQTNTARIVIVQSPSPSYVTRSGNVAGPIQTTFCVGDDIFFDNTTPGIAGASLRYTWEFFDDNTGIGIPIATRTQSDPVFQYNTSGQKLIRLTVRDANAAGNCEAIVESTVLISPSLVAQIHVTDVSGTPITPDFCQEPEAPYTDFSARFNDASIGSALPSTEWRWEFYDENNDLVLEAPSGGSFSATQLGPFDRVFTNKGIYRVRLIIRDNLTSCETIDEVQVRVFEKPRPNFTYTRACEGNPIDFEDASTLNPLQGEQIVAWEWDMAYDGVTFTKEPALDGQRTFSYNLGSAGTYQVALQVTTDQGCSAMIVQPVVIDPLPEAVFSSSVTEGCSALEVTFSNNGSPASLVVTDRYVWEVDAGSGFEVDSIQRPSDPSFSVQYTRKFINTGTTDKIFSVRLRAITVNNCERVSTPVSIRVFPAVRSGFNSLNYSPFNNNCSPQTVNFSVDNQTQSLNPSSYTWTIHAGSDVMDEINTGTTPAFSYEFVNTTQSIKDFQVRLRTTLSSGCIGDSTRIIRISPVPVSDFDVDTLEFNCTHMNLRFVATQRGLSEYQWSVRVNGTLLVNTFTSDDFFEHDFLRSENDLSVQVGLRTVNFANCESEVTYNDVIVPAYDNINASFTISPEQTTIPNSTVHILNTTNAGPWEYLWDFGDGSTSTDANVTEHTYETYGMYTIKLIVTNNVCKEEHTSTVVIHPTDPELDFEYNPPSGCAPLEVTFINKSKYADANSYFWKFGDGFGTSTAVNPKYLYHTPGVYTVTLSATNASGDTVQVVKHAIIEVYERPSAYFALKPQTVNIPGGKLFTDNRSFGASEYFWDFGDGTTSYEFEPDHEYKEEGLYDIMLAVSNEHQCRDTSVLEGAVKVVQGGQLLVPNAFSPNVAGPGNVVGQNDVFKPLIQKVSDFQLMVFNRWGELLFETKNPDEGWDGYFRGQLCPQDVYVYKITATYENGQVITRVGDVHLIR